MRLSHDNELIALYALGVKAHRVIGGLLFLALLFSILLLTISFLGMPLSKQFYKSFKESKKIEAKLNIVPGKLGQKFGNYYIYVKEKRGDIFHNIVIYNHTNKDEEQFFSSRRGRLNQKEGITSLLLNDGYGYTYTERNLQQVKYKTLEVYESAKKKSFRFENIVAYWSRAKRDITIMHRILFFTFVSLIPLLSVYLVASFTMINPRYQTNHSFIVIFLVTLLLYMIASSLEKWGNYLTLGVTVFVLIIGSRWLFSKRVARYF
jgi:lipopolysaccharide export system permease protein